jgi:hypothetical protein
MSDKKQKTRSEMIKKLAKEKVSDLPSIGEGLKKKKLSKVEIVAKDDEGLKKGLSMAEKLLQAKFGDKLNKEEDSEEETEESDEDCEACNNEGCPACKDEQNEDEESDLESVE